MALEPGHEIRLARRAREAVDLLAVLHHEQGWDAPHVMAVGDSRRVVNRDRGGQLGVEALRARIDQQGSSLWQEPQRGTPSDAGWTRLRFPQFGQVMIVAAI